MNLTRSCLAASLAIYALASAANANEVSVVT